MMVNELSQHLAALLRDIAGRFAIPRRSLAEETLVDDLYKHPEWLAFVAAIRANPNEDTPRLAAADWLEERGRADHADAIRRGCAKPKQFIFGVGMPAIVAYQSGRRDLGLVQVPLAGRVEGVRYTTDRGFICRLDLDRAEGVRWVRDVLISHPITEVRVPHSIRASEIGGVLTGFTIFRGSGQGDIPPGVFAFLKKVAEPDRIPGGTRCVYNSEAEAVADLAQACAAWARSPLTLDNPLLGANWSLTHPTAKAEGDITQPFYFRAASPMLLGVLPGPPLMIPFDSSVGPVVAADRFGLQWSCMVRITGGTFVLDRNETHYDAVPVGQVDAVPLTDGAGNPVSILQG